MELYKEERRKQEKVDGEIYDMSPSPNYKHSVINGNLYAAIKQALKNSLCMVFMENLDFKYHPEVNDDYMIPDIMIICDRKQLKGGTYTGVSKFIAETLSPSTALRDKTIKKDAYEKAGVPEYWIVSWQGSVEIYYLENGKYELRYSYILQDNIEEEDYNADTVICLKEFPNIRMSLADIFEGVYD